MGSGGSCHECKRYVCICKEYPKPGDQILINVGDSFTHIEETISGPNHNLQFIVRDDTNTTRTVRFISQSHDKGYEGKNIWREYE